MIVFEYEWKLCKLPTFTFTFQPATKNYAQFPERFVIAEGPCKVQK